MVRVLRVSRSVSCRRRGDRVRLEVGLERGGQRQTLETVDGGAGHYGAATQLLEAQYCGQRYTCV